MISELVQHDVRHLGREHVICCFELGDVIVDPGPESSVRTLLAGKPFAAHVVCRRYWSINLKEVRKLGTRQGGEYVDGIRFTYEGGQIRSLLSLLSYFGKGEMRERSLGIKIPPTNLKPDFGDQAQEFANKLADTLRPSAGRSEVPRSSGGDASSS